MPPGAHLKLAILAAALLMLMSPTVGADAEITVTQSYISKDRVDIGAEITVGYRLVWTATKASVLYAQVYINGRLCEQYSNGWYMLKDTAEDLAYKSYSIGSVIADGMPRSVQMNCDTETCVFDKVIVNMYPEYERVNLGEAPPIVWYAYYAFNFEVFKGEIVFNDTGPYDTIGTRGITVERIVDPVQGIHGFEADTVKITWDKVEVRLFSDKRRYDAGSEARTMWSSTSTP
jgi:hypothetical protein